MSRFEERFTEFQKALQRLKKAFDEPLTDMNRDASILRFKFTYELAWKTLKNYLATKDIDVRNAKDTLKSAYEQGMLQDADDWPSMLRHRKRTSHTYDQELADDVYEFVRDKGIALFSALEETLKGLPKP